MLIYRCILPQWALEENPGMRRVHEGEFTDEQIIEFNEQNYNIYFLPNHPSIYEGGNVDGFHVDTFNYVFVDMDLKDGVYTSKEEFISVLDTFQLKPTRIVDSGNGVHAYWRVTDLDAIIYLQIQRRLIRKFKTDEAIGQIYQLMRLPDTINTKVKGQFKLCQTLSENESIYTAEQMDMSLPPITFEDEQYCKQHYDKTYRKEKQKDIKDEIPLKFSKLLDSNEEVQEIWVGKHDDRSKADYRLGHIMFASGFTKEEATSVLVNTSKALARAPIHRSSYASNIVDKIWTFEISENKKSVSNLSASVRDILTKSANQSLTGKRFACWRYLDDTEYGLRLGQVIGLVGGSGVGKTTVAINMFDGFVENNPDYDHFYVPLEQPAHEIAARWHKLCQDKEWKLDKVHIISNYNDDGSFRHLSFTDIKDHILQFQQTTGRKAGCVVIDHIGALKKKSKDGENQDLMDICHAMKAFALETNTLLIMQSQTSREKAGIGDLELDKDAAYGTMYFEAYCDYMITIWQPLKRCYKEGAPTVTAFKFCKIRHKKQGVDRIQEDVRYTVHLDPETDRLREMTQVEQESFKFWVSKATNKRKQDRKTDIIEYSSASFSGDKDSNGKGKPDHNKDTGADARLIRVH